jgi:hypothetical protein
MELDWRDYSLVETRSSAVLSARIENVWTTVCNFGQFGEFLASIGMHPMASRLMVSRRVACVDTAVVALTCVVFVKVIF